MIEPGFWRDKTLEQLSDEEWEALCDGCGRCCLLKLEDEDSGRVWYTNVSCRLFDAETCRCGDYENRQLLVPQCVALTPEAVRANADWMPSTCAYRLLAEGRSLYEWHPLISGDPNSVHDAGISIRRWPKPEYEVAEEDLVDHALTEML